MKTVCPIIDFFIKRIICICLSVFIIQIAKAQSFNLPYKIDTIQSSALHAQRIIKVKLPDKFAPTNKYPVIYVLDEDWMFEPTVYEVKKLLAFNILPPCIIVGINSPNRSDDLSLDFQTGNMTASGSRFHTYLTQEVPQYIATKYSPSVFNILIGHSDGATFAQKAFTTSPDAFRAIICLSQNLFGDQLNDYIQFGAKNFSNKKYYYIASGTRDATTRISSGNKLDSLFQHNTNKNLKEKQQVFEADHSGVAGMGLGNGLSFVFSDYYQPNDWDRTLLDSLRKAKTDPVDFINTTMAAIKNNYGVEAVPADAGVLSTAFALVSNKEQASRYIAYRTSTRKEDYNFNSTIAQLYEKIKEYEIGLEYWIKYLNDPESYKKSFFYYRRPMEALAYKINDPKKAIQFGEEWEPKAPNEVKLSFKYFIAKIALEKNIEIKKGKAAIDYFIKNYKPELTQYKLEDAMKIKAELSSKK